MEAHDTTHFMFALRYRARVWPGQTLVMTYTEETNHPKYGPVTMRIWRAIGNDSTLKVQMTVDLLKKHEPNVGLWPGDVIQYLDYSGNLLDEEYGGVDQAVEDFINSYMETAWT